MVEKEMKSTIPFACHVLTVGIAYNPVKGGIAAVESTYSSFYRPFNHIASTCSDSSVRKGCVFALGVTKFLFWMIFRKEIKIVHIHGASNGSFWRKFVFVYIGHAFGKKIVYHMHGGKFNLFSRRHHKAVRGTIKRCDCIIALSEMWRDFFLREFPGKEVKIVHNVIEYPQKHRNRQKEFIMLFMGLLGQNKGIYDLLDVIIDHRSEFTGKLKLLIGGNGEVDKVKEIIDREGLSGIVRYEGWVSGSKKHELLNMADTLVLPSYNEGMPLSVLEALSYDIPVIASKVGGIPEVVHTGENGYLIEAGNKKALYDAIIEAMENRDKPIGGGGGIFVSSRLCCSPVRRAV